jgi:hypothetical protein
LIRRFSSKPLNRSHGDENAEPASNGCENQAFCDELPDKPCPAGAQRHTHTKLVSARSRPRHQKPCNIGAGDNQKQAYRRHQYIQADSRICVDDPVSHRLQTDAPVFVGFWKLALEPFGYCI